MDHTSHTETNTQDLKVPSGHEMYSFTEVRVTQNGNVLENADVFLAERNTKTSEDGIGFVAHVMPGKLTENIKLINDLCEKAGLVKPILRISSHKYQLNPQLNCFN